MRNLDDLTVREFIELEFNTKEDPIENIPKNILILTQKNKSSFLNILLYRSKLTEAILLLKLDFATALGIIGEFNIWKKRIQRDYYLIFENDEDKPSKEELEEYNKTVKTLSVGEIWGWTHVLHSICSTQIEIDYWMDKNVLELFTKLCYIKQLNLEKKKYG
jgi:hypothetical protein